MQANAPRQGRQALSPEVRLELTAPLFDAMMPLALVSLSYAVVGGVVLYLGESRDSWLTALYLLGMAVSCVRIWIIFRFRARGAQRPIAPNEVQVWERIFGAGTMAFGSVLGLFTARTITLGTPLVHELVIALLFGFGAGLVARVSIRPWIALSGLALAATPPVLALVQTGTIEHMILAAVLATFALGGVETTAYIYRAVRDQVQLKHHLDGLARRDSLTGLANRLQFEEQLEDALARGQGVAVHFVDLDRFKPVNDMYGHVIGDALLRAAAARLEGLLRQGDLAVRLGGDEFVVLQVNCTSRDQAEFVAQRIVRALKMPFDIAGRDIHVSASVGVAVAPQDGTDPASLVGKADAALYRAKNRGRGTLAMAVVSESARAS
ncbi:GGDEF domain-containing protein [Enterovirga aerilata]|uniref:GGDEF domain-containing protein n=1 Tax=Enterovirga aerilata TaxID=2730920 RepID=A0A849I223_9HYPH|nr:GGDEF domain-containing protein [Enterovirga sp. DB1703]NNM73422.1 GGDEF domain-containing protein [Enterovirga sp. DB1703]